MMKRIAFLMIVLPLLFGLSACANDPAALATPTPVPVNPGEIALTMIGQKAAAEATQMAVNVQFTATAQVIEATQNVESTQVAFITTERARQDAVATDQRARQDAAATEQRRRDDAATEQARHDMSATEQQMRIDAASTQSANATATWVVMTMTALPPHATLTQMAVQQQIALSTNEVELSNLQVRRQQQSNTLQALGPYTVALVLVVVLVVYILRMSRTKEFKNEEGVVDAVLLDNSTMVRPALMPGAVLNLGKTPNVPLLTDPETQNEIVRRHQAIEALRAMPTQSPTANGQNLMNSVFGEPTAPRFQILDAKDLPPAELLDENALKSLEQDWKEPHE
jgi:hypothetical protein